jgi:hypothetical protein
MCPTGSRKGCDRRQRKTPPKDDLAGEKSALDGNLIVYEGL